VGVRGFITSTIPRNDFRCEPADAVCDRTAGQLGAWEPTGVVRFGRGGTPYFVQGVRDNAMRILATLERSVGEGNFHYLVAV